MYVRVYTQVYKTKFELLSLDRFVPKQCKQHIQAGVV